MSEFASRRAALRQIAPELWVAESRVRFVGQWVPLQMVVARLGDGSLWLHSPVLPSPALSDALQALGPVRHLVAPSRYHHRWLGEWCASHPDAIVYGAPGLAEKRSDITFGRVLGNRPEPAWRGEFDQLVFRGLPLFNEVVFLHRRTRSLIVSDLVFNVYHAEGLLAPVLLRLNGMWRQFGPSRALSLIMRRNRASSRAGLRRILEWDFDRVVPAHGRVLHSGGPREQRRAFSFLLRDR